MTPDEFRRAVLDAIAAHLNDHPDDQLVVSFRAAMADLKAAMDEVGLKP